MAQTQVYNATTKQYVTLEVNDDLVNESLVEEDRLQQAKIERNILLQESDWALVSDSPLTDEQKTEATTYRQALRDLPAQEDFPNIAFPTKPDFL
tara:strand:+ start:14321 stop:14605 length:285 start_codon:yes stop_codon:yes gene_type:complete